MCDPSLSDLSYLCVVYAPWNAIWIAYYNIVYLSSKSMSWSEETLRRRCFCIDFQYVEDLLEAYREQRKN